MDVLLDEEESGEDSRENRGRGRWEHCWRVRGLVYVDVDVCSGTFSPVNAPDRAPVVSVLLAPDQPIRPIVDMSASNAPRVFPSHGVTESITVALLGSELLLPLVSHKARPCIAEG
ncbi:hypothetical protein Bca101_007264 [Brassica carinata]